MGIACERIETRSRLVPSKKRSKSFAPNSNNNNDNNNNHHHNNSDNNSTNNNIIITIIIVHEGHMTTGHSVEP